MPCAARCVAFTATVLLAMVFTVAQIGCGTIGFGGRGQNQLQSADTGTTLSPRLTTMVYAEPAGYDELPDRHNEQIVDIYLTDLSRQVLTAFATSPSDASLPAEFQIVHLHMFVRPHAGRTPIEPTSINAAVRYLIAADGRAGLYAGGGFVLPGGEPDGNDFRGKMTRGAVRLVAKGTGFVDQLGAADAQLGFDAEFNPGVAAGARAVLESMLTQTTPISSENASD